MAGKNETPRQKMIGMMYLVLTALLALQVSSALIYKFQTLNSSLEKTVHSTQLGNYNRQKNIEDKVRIRGNKPHEVALMKQSKRIRTETVKILRYIDELKTSLVQETGGYNEDGGFKGANEETPVEVLMIGASKSGKAYELKKKLDEYRAFMSKEGKREYESLAKHAYEDSTLKNNSDQKNKDYANLNFGQTPMVAALAVLSETEARIAKMENELLVDINNAIARDDYTFDRIKPVVKPVSDFVVAGTPYKAEMLMVATSSSIKPEMRLEERLLKVDEDGIGSLSFVASGGNYSPLGTMKKTWSGKIKIQKPNGTDTVYNVTHEYTVVKPAIQVQSGNIPALYKNCANKLVVSVPALGAEYNPRFGAQGASITNGSQPGSITLVPSGSTPRVELSVTNNGNFIGKEIFGVKNIPLPTVDVRIGNQEPNPITGIEVGRARTITIRIVPDKAFAEALPAEATYYIEEGVIYLARGNREIKRTPITGQNTNLAALAMDMRPGDRLVVQVSKVKRKNFRNEQEDVSMPKYFEIIPLN
jgi:gliding motility-associated protein GldM